MREVAILSVVVAVVGVFGYFGFQLERADTLSFWLFVLVPTAVLAVAALVATYLDGTLGGLLRPVWGDVRNGVLGGAALFAAAYLVVKFAAPVGSPRESWMARLYLQLGDPVKLREHMSLVGLVVVVAAFAEELVWRGWITSLLRRHLGPGRAWVYAAALYALAHLPTALALRTTMAGPNPALVFAALFGGLVWGAMAQAFKGRLLPSMVSHALFDWCALMMFRLWGASV